MSRPSTFFIIIFICSLKTTKILLSSLGNNIINNNNNNDANNNDDSEQQQQHDDIMLNDNGVKVRKPYTITKQRERWTEQEHDRFVDALKLHGRAWRKIEEHIGTKTAVQIRSHAQKFFAKLQKEQKKSLEADQLSDVTRAAGGDEQTRDTQTSAGGGEMTTMDNNNNNNNVIVGNKGGNNNSKLLIQALIGKKSQVATSNGDDFSNNNNNKEEDEADLLSNLANNNKNYNNNQSPATTTTTNNTVVRRTSSMSTGGGRTTASDIPPARPKRKPTHPYPRKESSLSQRQTNPSGFVNIASAQSNKNYKIIKKSPSISEALIDVARVEQQASASAAQALLNATSEMVRNRMMQEMQMQQMMQQQNNNNNNNNDNAGQHQQQKQNQQQQLIQHLSAPNPLSQLQAIMAANPMLAAMNFGGSMPGMANFSMPSFAQNIAPPSVTKTTTTTLTAKDAPNNKGDKIKPVDASNNNNNNNNNGESLKKNSLTDLNGEGKKSLPIPVKMNSQSAFSGYVRPTPSNQYQQFGNGVANNNNNNDAAIMAAMQQHQQMQYWNAQMAALAATQDPNVFAQFLQQQQMGSQMAFAHHCNSFQINRTPSTINLEAGAPSEKKVEKGVPASTQTPVSEVAKDIAKARQRATTVPQVPKEIENAMTNHSNGSNSDGKKESDDSKNGNNNSKDTMTNMTTGRRSRRAAAVVAAEKVTEQVSAGRTKRNNNNNNNGGSGSGSEQQPRNKNQGSSGSDGSDDVTLKGFETTSFRVYQPRDDR